MLAQEARVVSERRARLDRFVGIRLSPATYARLEAHAAEHGITVSAFMREALDNAAAEEVCTWTRVGGIGWKSRAGTRIYGLSGGDAPVVHGIGTLQGGFTPTVARLTEQEPPS